MPDSYFLSKGSHDSPDAGRCAMEWVAYIAGEPHSDQPACVSPVLRSFGISLNDQWDDEQRQKLRPYLARCIGTAGDGRDLERSWLATDWLLREFLPAFLDLVPSLRGHAARIRALPPVLAVAELDHCMSLVYAAWAAAWDAARAAAGAAAGDALKPTVTRLQASALVLFDRMRPTELVQVPAVGVAEASAVCGVSVA